MCLYGYLLVTCALIRVAYRIFSWGGGGGGGGVSRMISQPVFRGIEVLTE